MSKALTIRRATADASAATSRFPAQQFLSGSSFPVPVTADREEIGLYGFQVLRTANSFQRFVDEAIERTGELISHISRQPQSEEVIKAMDDISDTICSIIDSAELCRNTHLDREFVVEADKASMRISDYLHHFSGTRVVLDFAETPFNLFEYVLLTLEIPSFNKRYYAWDYRALRMFAKHYSTGEVIPES